VLFIRKETFFSIGGFQEIPIMEDVALMLTLRKSGIPIQILEERAFTSDRRWRKEGAVRGTLRNWTLFSLYRMGFSPERLVRRYKPHTE
jgi:hypothetical protein